MTEALRQEHQPWQDSHKRLGGPFCMAHGFGKLVPYPCPVIKVLDELKELEDEGHAQGCEVAEVLPSAPAQATGSPLAPLPPTGPTPTAGSA